MGSETRPLGPVGVELTGLDLRQPLVDGELDTLRRLVMEEGLVLLRDQPIEPDAQVALGRRFGSIEQLDVDRDGREPSMVVIGNVAADGSILPDDDPRMRLITINEGWHTDSAFRAIPASFSIFSAVIVPEVGGDTFYASLRAAWETLPKAEQEALYGLRGIHDYHAAYRRRGNTTGGLIGFDHPPLLHPLVRRHPETGATALYLSEHMEGIDGWSAERGQRLLERLVAHATRDDRVYRHRWREGDLALWDNRSMLHRAQGFDARYARKMHHVRIGGGEPPIAALPPTAA